MVMNNEEFAVQILFPGLTTGGEMYNEGEVVRNPSEYLVELARTKKRQFHRDSGKEMQIAKFVRIEKEDIKEEEFVPKQFRKGNGKKEAVVRSPVVKVEEKEEDSAFDDLKDLGRTELIRLADSLGMKPSFLKTANNDVLIRIIIFLRTI